MGADDPAIQSVAAGAEEPDRWAELRAEPGATARRRAPGGGRSGGSRLGRAIRPALPGLLGMGLGAAFAWWRDLPLLALGFATLAVALVLGAVFWPRSARLVGA